jgi:hypothetical protein
MGGTRRGFIQEVVAGGGLVLEGGGFLLARHSLARGALASKMVDDALR